VSISTLGADPVVEQRLRAARAQLVLQHPFLGALLLKLPMRADNRCRTIAGDGNEIRFSPAFFSTLSLTDIQFHLTHQVLHVALGHPWRRGHRLHASWDLACDYAVNQLLLDEGFKLGAGAVIDERFRGLSAEEIYPFIDFGESRMGLDDHPWGTTSHRSIEMPAMTQLNLNSTNTNDVATESVDVERESDATIAEDWQANVTQLAQSLRSKGRLSASLQRALDAALEPELPWNALLARFLASHGRDDYSFHRLSRRGGDALLPSLHSQQTNLVVAIDSSGSISDAELNEFIAEIDALKSQVRAQVSLLACDVALHAQCPWHFAATDLCTA
jgi:predicted metal-dependent peptidase